MPIQKRLSVSVIIPTYNRGTLISETIDSLLTQTRVPDEIIIIDDGSTDNTAETIKKYQHESIKYIYQTNKESPAARNTGLRAATGDLIAFLNSDDTLPPESIARRADYLEQNPDSNIVYGAAYYTDLQGRILRKFLPIPLPSGWIFYEVACHSVFPPSAVMLRRSCRDKIGFFDEELYLQWDMDYWARAAVLYPFDTLNEIVAYYRVHESMSVIRQREELNRKGILVQQRIMKMPAFAQLTQPQKSRVYVSIATKHVAIGEVAEARKWFAKAITANPVSVAAYALLIFTLLGKGGTQYIASIRRRIRARQWANTVTKASTTE